MMFYSSKVTSRRRVTWWVKHHTEIADLTGYALLKSTKMQKNCQINAVQNEMVSKTQYSPLCKCKVASIGFYSPLHLLIRSKVFFNNVKCVEYSPKIRWGYRITRWKLVRCKGMFIMQTFGRFKASAKYTNTWYWFQFPKLKPVLVINRFKSWFIKV